jgi:hypothetical protein
MNSTFFWNERPTEANENVLGFQPLIIPLSSENSERENDPWMRLIMDYSTDLERYSIYEEVDWDTGETERFNLRVFSGFDNAYQELKERCKTYYVNLEEFLSEEEVSHVLKDI